MTQRELLYTVTIYDEGSFSAAAKKLFVSQPALSQAIQKLEEELGMTLFTRSAGKTVPTTACKVFVDHGRPLLDAFDRFEKEMHVYAESRLYELSVSMPPYKIRNLMPFILPEFRELHPDVKVDIIEERSDMAEQLAMQDLINFCIVNEPVFVKNIERIPLYTGEFLLAVPKDHPFAKKHPYRGLSRLETVDLGELRDEPFALLKNSRVNQIWPEIFGRAGFEPVIYRRSTVFNNIKDYVKRGVCVALLHELIVTCEPDEESISYYRIGCLDLCPPTVAAFYPGKRLSAQELAFIDKVKQYQTIAKRQE